jgi:hypothetical protein
MAEQNSAQEWAEEFLGERDASRDQKAWQKAIVSESYLATAKDPKSLIGFYENDPQARPTRRGRGRFQRDLKPADVAEDPADIKYFQQARAKKGEFVAGLEDAYHQFRGEIPMEFWLQQSPTELRAFGDGAYDEIATWLEDAHYNEAVERQLQDAAAAQWEQEISAQENRQDFLSEWGFNASTAETSPEMFARIQNELRGKADVDYEDEIAEYMDSERRLLTAMREGAAAPTQIRTTEERFYLSSGDELSQSDHKRFWDTEMEFLEAAGIKDITALSVDEFDELLEVREAFLRSEVRGAPKQLDKILTPGRGMGFLEGAMGGVGAVMEKALHFGGLAMEQAGPVAAPFNFVTKPLLDKLFGTAAEARADTIAQIQATTGRPDGLRLAEFGNKDAHDAWEEMQETEPEMFDTYIQMAGLDPIVAFSFFQADLKAQVTPDQQLEYLSDLTTQENERLEQLKDSDFTVGDDVLHWLGVWGRNVPMRLATMYSIMLTDDDYQTMAKETRSIGGLINTMQRVAEQSEAAGHTPSRALGIDGSVAGLMLDLGGGIAFDPTTWIFGPRLGARGVSSATAASAKNLAKSRMVTQMGDDAVRMLQSPSRGVSSVYHALDWLDEVSMGEILQLVDMNPQVLNKAPWRTTKGHKAIEVRTSMLDELIPSDLRIGEDLTGLSDDIIENGFKEPVVMEISRADNSIRLVDGSKRVMASNAGGISHVPATVRIVDDVAPGTKVIPGVSDEATLIYQRAASMEVKGGANPEIVSQLKGTAELMQQRVDMVGSAGTRVLKNGDEVSIKFVSVDDTGGVYWAEAANGEIVGVVQAGEGVGGIATMPGHTQNGVFSSIMDAASEMGDDLITKLDMEIISPDGLAAIQGYSAKQMSKAVVESPRAGRLLDELLQEGEELGKPLLKPGSEATAHVRPDAVLPNRLLTGQSDDLAASIHEILERAIVGRGAVPRGSQYGAVARSSGEKIRKLARANAPGRWMERYMTPAFVGKRFEYAGPHAVKKITDTLYRIFGEDSIKLNEHLGKLMAWQKKNSARSGLAAKKLSELAPRGQRLRRMQDMTGDMWDDALRDVENVNVGQAKINRDQLRRLVNEEDSALKAKYAEIDAETSVLGATDELEDIMTEIWNDYNRTYIATNPAWAGVELVDDMVPWEMLGKGTKKPAGALADDAGRAIPETVQEAAEAMGIDAEVLAQRLAHSQNAKLAFEAPVSPLDLIMARELGGAAYTRFTHINSVSSLRETVQAAHRLWTIDKVFTVATAATVSFDELLRIFHIGGAKAVTRWMRDRAIYTESRVQAIVHGKGISKQKGAGYLSPKKQERLRSLNDMPELLKQAERQSLEQHGLGWSDIAPGEAGYNDAARAWSGGFIQDSGFRAFLRGRDEFQKWFLSPDGERLRKGSVVGLQDGKPGTMIIESADEFYNGWSQLFDDVILQPARKGGKFDEVRAAWVDGAKRVDDAGGLPKDMPDFVYNYMGPVRGVKRDLGKKASTARLQEAFFDKLFMDPVNYRRGFLAELTRTHERSRLRSLFESQGKRIVSDSEIESLLGLQGLAGSQRTGLRAATQDMALKAGYIPESYVDDLVEQAVLSEIENTLYAFDSSSRMGSQAKAVFPFGKPWADMAGFWGREVVRKPALRGWINNSNFMGLRSMNDAGLLSFPLVPNRSSALISRLSATDFTIDKGLIGGEGEGILHEGGLIPGATESDFSPLFFLPTAGDNPFSYMIPGVGILPMAWLDYYMTSKYDPVDQPEEYQKLKDDIAQIVPSAAFSQGGNISRLLGGGTLAKAGGMAVDISGMLGGDSYFNITSQMGDIGREIDRTREVSALLADPEELALLLDASSPEEADLLIQALAMQADKNASRAHLAESVTRYMAPVSNRFDASLAEIQDVWLDAGAFEELSYLSKGVDIDRMTDDERRALANDVRKEFFRLEGYQRDILVVQQPSLAVNMVGSWEWTPQAINQNLEKTQFAYRTGGSKKDLALHETLVKQGLIRPVQPIVRARRILGVIDNARKSAAKELYVEQTNQINGMLWDAVPEDVKGQLEWIVDTEFATERDLRSAQEVWFNWNQVEEDLEFWLAAQEGIDPVRGVSERKADKTAFDRLRSAVKIPTKWKPWGRTFPGLDEETVSKRMNEWEVQAVDPKSQAIAKALGIELNVGTTGEELFEAVQQVAVQRENFVYDVARPDYDRYILDRSNRSGQNMMYEAAQSDLVSPEFQDHIKNFLFIDGLMGDRYDDEAFVPLQDQLKMSEMFMFVMKGSKDQKTDWEGIWEQQYERSYGPLGWTPPEPLSPLDENGQVAGGVIQPYIRHIVDGDTILMQTSRGSQVLNSVRLLGIDAAEVKGPDAEAGAKAEADLKEAILQAVENGDSIYLVQDDRFGKTDHYGRMLAWLWIGDTPYYNVEDLLPSRTPSGSN